MLTRSVFVDNDFASDPVSRKSTTGLVAQIGYHTEIWIDASELDSTERWRSGVLRSGERRSSWTILEIYVPEQDCERSTLTCGTSGYKNEFKTETAVSRRCLQRRIALMLERSQSLLQYYNNIASLQDWYSGDLGSHTPLEDEGDEPVMDLVTELQNRHEHARAQKQTVVSIDREHRDGCAS